MTRTVFTALLSHWWRNPLQLFTLLAGLALATALWSGVQAINAEARQSYDAAAATLGEGQFDQMQRRDGQPMEQATYVALRRAGWLVSPVVEGRIDGLRVVGLDPLTAPGGMGPVQIDEGLEIGAFLMGEGQVFGTATTLEKLVSVDVQKVASPDVAPDTVITDIGVAQVMLGKVGQVDRLIVAANQPLGQIPLNTVAPQLAVQPAQGGSDIGRLTDSFHLNLTAFGLLSFAVGIFIVNGAIGLAFEQRRPVVRTLRALGVPLRRLMVLMAAELCVMALVAGIVGVLLGYVIASTLLPGVAATLRGLYGADVAGTLQLRPSWWLSGLAIALGVGSLALVAIYPFAKRFTWWPQVFLGLAFNWGALLAWAAHSGSVTLAPVLLYLGGISWTLFYDTIYAHQDREDDALIGIKSTARLFGARTRQWLSFFMILTLVMLSMAIIQAMGARNAIAMTVALGGAWVMGWHLAWQLRVLDIDNPDICLRLFRANRNTGLIPVLFLAVSLLL